MPWSKQRVWMYFMDTLTPTPLTVYDLAELYGEDSLKPFDTVKNLVSKHMGGYLV